MALLFSVAVTTFLLLISWVCLLKICRRSKTPKFPPGPWKLPIIGNLHNLVGSLPHRILRELARKHGPLMHLQLGEVSTVVVSSPSMAKEFLKTHDLAFAQRPLLLSPSITTYGGLDIGFSPYGDYWRQMRRVCVQELLSAKQVHSFNSLREKEVGDLIASIRSSSASSINFSEHIMRLSSTIIFRAAFGSKCKDQDAFLSLLKKSMSLAAGFELADLFPSQKFIHVISGIKAKQGKIHKQMDKIMENIIKEHREKSASSSKAKVEQEDLVDVLLGLQESGTLDVPITTNNIKAVILDMFAGSDTSSTTIEWAMSEMIRNPRVLGRAQNEIRQVFKGRKEIYEKDLPNLRYLKLVIKETLRLHPPLPLLLPRECREGCKVDGYEMPIKTRVLVNAWAIGRDPEHWHDAESFLPERFAGSSIDYKGTSFEYLLFGAGRRMCPGLSFGLANVELPLAQLLYQFDWELPDKMKSDDLDMTEDFGVVARRKNHLCLSPTNCYSFAI